MSRLFTTETRKRWRGSRALAVLDPERCPACNGRVAHEATHQPALLRHGGYGATERRTLRVCINEACRWTCEIEVQELKP